jgi:hypothetical protein
MDAITSRAIFATLVLLASHAGPQAARAALIYGMPGETISVDFAGFRGAGFSPTPSAGQLDSNVWRVGGMSQGDLPYGAVGATGDFARGTSSGGVTTGGIYAFDVADGQWALGVQATGSDFNPGFLELWIRNASGQSLANWQIDYQLYCRNDQNRSSGWQFSYSTDGSVFTPVAPLDYASPAAKDSQIFQPTSWSSSLPLTLADGQDLFLRWRSADLPGSGSRDEFALDNVAIHVDAPSSPEPPPLPPPGDPSTVPEPSSFMIMGLGTLLLAVAGVGRRWRHSRACAKRAG